MTDFVLKTRKELEQKLELEKRLKRKLNNFNNLIVAETVDLYMQTGNTLDMTRFDDDMTEILSKHYALVTDEFTGTISDDLPDDVGMTDEEKAAAALALLLFLNQRSDVIGKRINSTTQDNIELSIIQAGEDELVRDETGQSKQISVAVLTGAILREKLKGRVDGIALQETHFAAETVKSTEAEILSGLDPSITTITPRHVDAFKEWVTVGDSKVRDAHVAADGQVQKIGDPFFVGFEQLMIPRDASLGASLGNIINCRCSVGYNIDSIIAVRSQ